MSRTQELGAQAFVDHVMPIVREAHKAGDGDEMVMAYSGCLGALWGSLVADFGTEMAGKMLDMMVRKIKSMDRLDEPVQ